MRVLGASRTDSGVHAFGQIAAFDSPREIPLFKWVRGLNGALAYDLAVREAVACEPGYNPRYHASGKTYRYLLHLGPTRDPMLRNRAWHLSHRRARPCEGRPEKPEDWLDIDAMRAAAATLIGRHDFRAFKASRDPREQTVRTLTKVELTWPYHDRRDLIAIEIRGNAFLHNMVRIIAGTLVDVGREYLPVECMAKAIESGERDHVGQTAPAHGLYLVDIELGR